LKQVVTSEPAHAMEHSLEVQVPFLQKTLGEFALVPFAVGSASAAEVAETIERLWGGDETLIVISTDLSHYHSYDEARAIDGRTLARITALATDIVHEEACGATPLNGMLQVARARGLPSGSSRRTTPATRGRQGPRGRVFAFALDEGPRVTAAAAGQKLLAMARGAIAQQLGTGTLR
jgi:AmmeMemoRadiSam system protein B